MWTGGQGRWDPALPEPEELTPPLAVSEVDEPCELAPLLAVPAVPVPLFHHDVPSLPLKKSTMPRAVVVGAWVAMTPRARCETFGHLSTLKAVQE